MNNRLAQRPGTWDKVRALIITAGICYLVHAVVAFFTLVFNIFPNGYPPQAHSARYVPWCLATLQFMADHYPEALLVTVIGAAICLWRGATIRQIRTLIIGLSILWWVAMIALRFISTTPLGWYGTS
jgi:hypothetical protein